MNKPSPRPAHHPVSRTRSVAGRAAWRSGQLALTIFNSGGYRVWSPAARCAMRGHEVSRWRRADRGGAGRRERVRLAATGRCRWWGAGRGSGSISVRQAPVMSSMPARPASPETGGRRKWPRLMSVAIPRIGSALLGGTGAQLTGRVAADIHGGRRWLRRRGTAWPGAGCRRRVLRLELQLGRRDLPGGSGPGSGSCSSASAGSDSYRWVAACSGR
jgi:hypothetical protein